MAAPLIVNRDGWWWPATDVHARPVLMRDAGNAVPALLKHVSGRDLIVQAGSNVGLFPITLADHFRVVITAEPDHANFACLKKNVAARDSLKRVTVLEAAFGEAEGDCTPTEVERANCGAHRVEFGSGAVPVWTIDGLLLDDLEASACNAIWLDVEGSELLALKGAERTIRQFSPVICIEDKGLHRAFGIPDGALQDWLVELGYEQVDKIGNDKVFKRTAE